MPATHTHTFPKLNIGTVRTHRRGLRLSGRAVTVLNAQR